MIDSTVKGDISIVRTPNDMKVQETANQMYDRLRSNRCKLINNVIKPDDRRSDLLKCLLPEDVPLSTAPLFSTNLTADWPDFWRSSIDKIPG